MDRDWDKELAKIDRQLEGTSDQAMFPVPQSATPGQQTTVVETRKRTASFGAFARLLLAVALGVGVAFWPYPVRCGLLLAGYLAAVAAVIGAGVWSSIWTWRHRTAKAHVLSLLIVLWGIVLGAQQVLPRVPWPTGATSPVLTWLCR
jgi:hypothetical protein